MMKIKSKGYLSLTNEIDLAPAMQAVAVRANRFGGNLTFVLSGLFLMLFVLIMSGVFHVSKVVAGPLVGFAFLSNLASGLVCLKKKGEGKALIVVLFVVIFFSVFFLTTIMGYGGWFFLSVPIIFSVHYYDTRITIIISAITELVQAISILAIVLIGEAMGRIDLNYVVFTGPTALLVSDNLTEAILQSGAFSLVEYIKQMFTVVFLNNTIILGIIALISVQGARHGREMLIDDALILSEKAKAEKEAADSKMQIMISQIQPHFIYNTLNTIYYLCDKEPEVAKKAIAEFSDYLRTNLNFMDRKKELIPFPVEMEHIQKYLDLEKMRFVDELNIEYDIRETSFKVPALSIQPLVENAVKHGVCKRSGGGTVKITSIDALSHYEIRIEDDGVGFDTNSPYTDDRRHIGLENTKTRIEEMSKGTLEIQSTIGVGTKVIIKLPKENYYENPRS